MAKQISTEGGGVSQDLRSTTTKITDLEEDLNVVKCKLEAILPIKEVVDQKIANLKNIIGFLEARIFALKQGQLEFEGGL